MGFKNMKRDDHGHVISNDEQDGQKCQHQGGGSNNRQDVQNRLDAARKNLKKVNDVENIAKYNREIGDLEKQLSSMPDDSFDDDYEEEFKEYDLSKDTVANKLHEDVDEDGDDYDEEEKVRYLDKTYNRYFDNQENWKRNETGNYEIGDDENYGYVLNDGERPGMIRAGRVRNADHEHPEEEFFEDPQEAKEWVEEVANGDNLDLNDRKTRETLVDDYDEYRGSQGNQENEMKSRYQKIREVLGDNADETIEWLFNHLSKLNDYKKSAASKPYKGEIKYRKDNDMYYPVKEDGTYLDKDIKFPDLKSLQDVYGEGIKEDTEDHWLRKHKHH